MFFKKSIAFGVMMSISLLIGSDRCVVDQDVILGKLDNGLTYYIKKHDFPKKKASLSLFVKVGSLHENEEERGVAHFVEHMAFRGSKNFADWEVIHYLESLGAKFGSHTNAETTFDHTEYVLEIPLEKEEALPKGILILSDYAGRVTFDETLIDKERHVIMEEFKQSTQNVSFRTLMQFLNLFSKDSYYAQRLPIGLEKVILGAPKSVIKGFYDKWYRPDLMAVVAVGDFDVSAVESMIRNSFENLPKQEAGHIVLFGQNAPTKERKVLLISDPEFNALTGILLQFQERSSSSEEDDEEEELSNQSLCYSLFRSILDKRFEVVSRSNPSPFMAAGCSHSHYFDNVDLDLIYFVGFEDRPLEGLKAVYEEVARYKRFGCSESEFMRAKEERRETLQKAESRLDKMNHREFVDKCIDHFTEGKEIYLEESVIKAEEEDLDQLTLEDMNEWIKTFFDLEGHHVVFQLSDESIVSEASVWKALEALKESEVKEVVQEAFVSLEVERGSPIECLNEITFPDYRVMTLENGLKVILHPSKEENEKLSIEYIAKGGKTLFPESLYPSLSMAADYLFHSGIGNLRGSQLSKYLDQKGIYANLSITGDTRSLMIGGRSEYAEEIMKFGKAVFTDKVFDENSWENLVAVQTELEKHEMNNPSTFFNKKLQEVLFSGHPFYKSYSIKEMVESEARECVDLAFSDPSEFYLLVVGDFDMEEMKQLVLSYCNFPRLQTEQKNHYPIPKDVIPKECPNIEIRKGKEGAAITLMAYGAENQFEPKRGAIFTLKALNHILQARLQAKMRQDLGSVYGVGSYLELPFWPTDLDMIISYVQFTSEEEKIDQMQNEVVEVIQALLKEGLKEDEIATAKELVLQEIIKSFESNQSIKYLHKMELFLGTPFMSEEVCKSVAQRTITQESLMKAAQMVFEGKCPVKIRLLPEKA